MSLDVIAKDEALPPLVVDEMVFDNIIMLDEDDKHQFSTGILNAYYVQAAQVLAEMKQLLNEGRLAEFARKAHFVKSSSSTIGALRIAELCHKLQLIADTQCGFVEEQKRQVEILKVYLTQLPAEVAKLQSELALHYGIASP